MPSFRITLAFLPLLLLVQQAVGCSIRPPTSTREGNWIKNLLTTANPDVVKATVERKVGCSENLEDLEVTIQLSTGEVAASSAPVQLLNAPGPTPADDIAGGFFVSVEGFHVTVLDAATNTEGVGFTLQGANGVLPDCDFFDHAFFVDTVNSQQHLYFLYEDTFSSVTVAVVNLSTNAVNFSYVTMPDGTFLRDVVRSNAVAALYPEPQMAVLAGDSGRCTGDMILHYDEFGARVVYQFSAFPFDFSFMNPFAADFFNTNTAHETYLLLSTTAPDSAGEESEVCTQSGATYTIETPVEYEITEYSMLTGAHMKTYPLNALDVEAVGLVQLAPDLTMDECFSGDMTVNVIDKGIVSMEALALGDQVLVDQGGKYEEVYSFGHRNVDSTAEFVQVTVDHAVLELSKDHMVLVDGDRFIPASLVKVGDHLTSASGDSKIVTGLQPVVRQGLYAPFTASGTIVVNGIVASNYISHQNSEHLVVAGLPMPLTYQWLAHSFNALHRVAIRLGVQGETYTKEGISNWVYLPHLCFCWALEQQHMLVASLLPTVVLMSMTLALEYILGHSPLIVSGLLALMMMSRRRCKQA